MATQKKKKRPSGPSPAGGRPGAQEPRVQVFGKFGGCNFQLSPRDFDYIYDDGTDHGEEQTDLMPNLMVIQNNAAVAPNFTIQTRQSLKTIFTPPPGKTFTGVATLVQRRLYAACTDGSSYQDIHHALLPASGGAEIPSIVALTDKDGSNKPRVWTYLGYADGQLVGMTAAKQLWTGVHGSGASLTNAKVVPNPTASDHPLISAVGKLSTSSSWSSTTPFRIRLQFTWLNKYGPTKPSPPLTFYASKPTTEWSGSAYVQIDAVDLFGSGGSVPDGYDITAVELYFSEGEYQDPAFLGRVNLPADNGARKTWKYNWRGYQFDTSNWTIANLMLPTENHTGGVPASMMESIDGRLYFWGGSPAHRVWIGGNPGNRFSISAGTGGGWVDCSPGSNIVVRDVLKFKTQQGASMVTMLCDSQNSQQEFRFNLVENNISLSNEQSAKGWQAEKIAGTVGCKSSKGAIVTGDGLYTVSRYGLAITTHTMEYNSQLQVQYVSDAIEPVFTKQYGSQFKEATLFAVNDVLYMTFGSLDGDLDNVIFCYDIGMKAWWTYTIDVDAPILNMIHIDHEDVQEGIGIVTPDAIYLLPTTREESVDEVPLHEILIESAELSAMQPLQNMHHLSQLEFRFDHFIGELDIIVKMIDRFGRKIDVRKRVTHDQVRHHLSEYLRIDQVVESYKVILKGRANMRLTHFISKNYPKSNRIGSVYGFDSRASHTSPGSIHRTFADYNDLKEAIIP